MSQSEPKTDPCRIPHVTIRPKLNLNLNVKYYVVKYYKLI